MNLEDIITQEIETVRQSHGHIDARMFARHLLQKADQFIMGKAKSGELDQALPALPAPEPVAEELPEPAADQADEGQEPAEETKTSKKRASKADKDAKD